MTNWLFEVHIYYLDTVMDDADAPISLQAPIVTHHTPCAEAMGSGQGWQVVAKGVFTTGFNRLKPAGKNPWWQKVAKSGKKSNEAN